MAPALRPQSTANFDADVATSGTCLQCDGIKRELVCPGTGGILCQPPSLRYANSAPDLRLDTPVGCQICTLKQPPCSTSYFLRRLPRALRRSGFPALRHITTLGSPDPRVAAAANLVFAYCRLPYDFPIFYVAFPYDKNVPLWFQKGPKVESKF